MHFCLLASISCLLACEACFYPPPPSSLVHVSLHMRNDGRPDKTPIFHPFSTIHHNSILYPVHTMPFLGLQSVELHQWMGFAGVLSHYCHAICTLLLYCHCTNIFSLPAYFQLMLVIWSLASISWFPPALYQRVGWDHVQGQDCFKMVLSICFLIWHRIFLLIMRSTFTL